MLAVSYAVAYQLTRRSQPRDAEPVPALTWGTVEAVLLRTSDGEELGAWHLAGREDRPAVVLLHGNGGQKSACLKEAEFLAASGCSVLLVTLRAHGESSGESNDFGYSARHDVIAAVQWLADRHSQQPVVVWGQSLGAAAACFAAEELGDRVQGYILECVYRDLHSAVWNRLHARLPPVADRLAYAGMLAVSPLVLADVDRISPCQAIAAMPPDVPVLLLAGSEDSRAPVSDAAAICQRVPGQAKLVVIEGAGHLHLEQAQPTLYRESILELLESANAGQPSGAYRRTSTQDTKEPEH